MEIFIDKLIIHIILISIIYVPEVGLDTSIKDEFYNNLLSVHEVSGTNMQEKLYICGHIGCDTVRASREYIEYTAMGNVI